MYIYAFIKAPQTPLELPQGIAGKLQVLIVENLAAIVEPDLTLQKIEIILEEDRLLQRAYVSYGLVICEIFRQTTLLPLKFYHCFADSESLIQHLSEHQVTYLQQLERLEGKGEYILRLTPQPIPEPVIDYTAKGRDYFLAKKQRYQFQQDFKTQQAQELDLLLEAITQVYPDTITSDCSSESPKIYLLVHQQAVDLLHQHQATWQKLAPRWNLTLGEAIPPYDFLSSLH